MLTAEIKELFSGAEKEQLVVITVGNPFRSDDGVGAYLASHSHPNRKNLILMDAGENLAELIDQVMLSKPQKIIIIDAANFGGKIGEIKIIPEELIPQSTISTHSFPLNFVTRIMAKDTGAKVFFLGIQGHNFALGEKLSPPVKKTADQLIEFLFQI